MLPLCLPVPVSCRLHCSRRRERDWSLSLTLPCCSVSSSHCAAEEAEATVQGERGGQEAQAAQSPERGKLSSPSLALQLQLDPCPDVTCFTSAFISGRVHATRKARHSF